MSIVKNTDINPYWLLTGEEPMVRTESGSKKLSLITIDLLKKVVKTTEERDGKVLLNDPQFPFANLKKHGERFASHFRLKKVNSPFLFLTKIYDTPDFGLIGLIKCMP